MTTPPNLSDAAILDVFSRIVSFALESGRFDQVNQHEPKSGPGVGLLCSIWVQDIRLTRSSGLAAASGVLTMNMRLYMNFRSEPFDMIDFNILTATNWMMAQLCGDFQLGNADQVRNIDLLGSQGTPLNSKAGYVEIDKTVYRVMTLTIPIIVNDMFVEVA
jgi:hypothetical protein